MTRSRWRDHFPPVLATEALFGQAPSSSVPMSRLVVVDETGRVYDRTGIGWSFSVQDDGQTLKIFVRPLPTAIADIIEHTDNLARELGQL